MSETFYGPDFTLLSKQDPDIAAVLLSELKRQQTNLQLIASENFTSRAVLAALGSTLSNKYAEGYQASVTTVGVKKLIRPRILRSSAHSLSLVQSMQMCNPIQVRVQISLSIKHLPSREIPSLRCHFHTVGI